jgi:two-component system LytT family response regulator
VVTSVEEASSGAGAVRAIRSGDYDLVFLDVAMPNRSGVDVIEDMGDRMPTTVLVTSREEFDVQAFDVEVTDYLLKPIDEERFATAFDRALRAVRFDRFKAFIHQVQDIVKASGEDSLKTQVGNGRPQNGVAQAETETKDTREYLERLTVEGNDQIYIVPIRDIRYVTAEDMYVRVHTHETSYLLRERLYKMEERLDPAQFARIHRSTIVRLDCIESLVQRPGGDYLVKLNDAKQFRVSRSRQEELIRRLEMGPSR